MKLARFLLAAPTHGHNQLNMSTRPQYLGSRETCQHFDDNYELCLTVHRQSRWGVELCKDVEEKYYQCIQYGWGKCERADKNSKQ
jgi:hypothetical protein